MCEGLFECLNESHLALIFFTKSAHTVIWNPLFNFILDFFSAVILLKCSGSIVSHTTGPNHLKDNLPMYSVFAFGIKNVFLLVGSETN